MLHRAGMAAPIAALLLSGCSTQDGGGPLGFVAFDKNHQVAAAEPLFGKDEDKCLDRPGFLISLFSGDDGRTESYAPAPTRAAAKARGRSAATAEPVCAHLRGEIRAALAASSVAGPGGTLQGDDPVYSERQRNEVMDALIAASNRKCGRYIAYLQTWDANINSTFGIASLATAGLATFVGGESTAKALAGASGFLNGTRSTFNEAHFRNRTIAVLATAFENARQEQREEITNRQQCPAGKYTLMRGMEDSFRYHATCSVVAGLDEASRAVQRSNAPDLETMKKIVADALEIRRQLAAADPVETGATDASRGAGPNGGKPAAGKGASPGGGAASDGSSPDATPAPTVRSTGTDKSNVPHCPFTQADSRPQGARDAG